MRRRFIKNKMSFINLAFEKLNSWVEKKQRGLANYLNQKCKQFSARQLKIGLVIFCFAFGIAAAFTIWSTLSTFGSRNQINRISVPLHSIVKRSDSLVPVQIPELIAIQKFWTHLESLKQSSAGQQTLDSIKTFRPGLLDSLQLVEKIYKLNTSEHEK